MKNRKKIRGTGYGHDTLALVGETADGRQAVIPSDRICSVHVTFTPAAKDLHALVAPLDFKGAHLAGVGLQNLTEDTWECISAELELSKHFASAEFGVRMYPYEAADPESAAVQAFLEASLDATGAHMGADDRAELITRALGRPAPVTGPGAAVKGEAGKTLQSLDWPTMYGLTVLPLQKRKFAPTATDTQFDTLTEASTVREIGEAAEPIVARAAKTSPLLAEAREVAPHLTGRPALVTSPTGGAVFLYPDTHEDRNAAHEAAWELRRRFADHYVRGGSSWKGEK